MILICRQNQSLYFFKNTHNSFWDKIKTLLKEIQVKDYKNGFSLISSFDLHRLVESKSLADLNALAKECDEFVCFVSHSTVGLYGFFHYQNGKCLRGYASLDESGEVLHNIGNISDAETELGLYFPPCSEEFTEECFDEINHEALEKILQLIISTNAQNLQSDNSLKSDFIYDKQHIIEQYEKSGKIMYDATLNGDYKKNNREGAKLTKIFKYFEQNRELAYECISEMFNSKNVVVKTKAAAYCLALNERTALAEQVLEEIANEPSNGILGFNAEMTLKVWKKQGFLKIY